MEADSIFKLFLPQHVAAFLRWCDSEDLAAFYDPKHHTLDLLRLAYIALAVGYRLLALNIIANIGPTEQRQTVEISGKIAIYVVS